MSEGMNLWMHAGSVALAADRPYRTGCPDREGPFSFASLYSGCAQTSAREGLRRDSKVE